jgi:hypothetical protein
MQFGGIINYFQNVFKILAYSQIIRPEVIRIPILAVVGDLFYFYHCNNIYRTPWPADGICKAFLEKLISHTESRNPCKQKS